MVRRAYFYIAFFISICKLYMHLLIMYIYPLFISLLYYVTWIILDICHAMSAELNLSSVNVNAEHRVKNSRAHSRVSNLQRRGEKKGKNDC